MKTRPQTPNGSGAAAILAAGVACFALGILAFAGDKSAAVKNSLVFYKPTGALSGVSTVAIGVWLIIWLVLERRWGGRNVSLGRTNAVAFVLLVLGLLLTFPPVDDLL